MFGALVRTTTGDNVTLSGMHFEPNLANLDQVVLHIHGSLGDFYENSFIDYFAEFYTSQGLGFLTTNNRGHDTGGITERFDDAVIDITTWLRYAWARGYRHVILQGHSLGALKAVHAAANLESDGPKVTGVVLLAPFDIVSFYCKHDMSTRTARLGVARDVANSDPAEVMPRSFWDLWPISAGTFVDLVQEDSHADIFPFRLGSLTDTPVMRCSAPVFAAIGAADFAAYPSPANCVSQLSALDGVTAMLIDDAPHNFAGKEHDLLACLGTWLLALPETSGR